MTNTNTCRSVGNAIEYLVCKCLIRKRFVPQSSPRLDKMQMQTQTQTQIHSMSHRVCLALDYVIAAYKEQHGLKRLPPGGRQFALQSDNAGSSVAAQPTTGDVIIANNLHISIKHNNLSLKHQKANKLALQLQLVPAKKASFESSFTHISAEFYKRWKSRGTFAKITFEERMELYDRINRLTVEYLNGATKAEFARYISFILSGEACNKSVKSVKTNKSSYILNCDTKGNRVSVLSTCKALEATSKDKKPTIEIRGTFIYITIGKTIIKMRLHTCTSRITPCIGLKYDTRLETLAPLAVF